MERPELLRQYDRFIDQVRTEVKDLYWLYNFFFFIDSAMVGGIFFGKLTVMYSGWIEIIGVLLSLYWLNIIRKQRLWRNDWVEKIQEVETRLGYENDIWMWKYKGGSKKTFHEYILGKRGLWDWLYLLPIGFITVWIVLLVG